MRTVALTCLLGAMATGMSLAATSAVGTDSEVGIAIASAPETAHGGDFASWWGNHGPQVVEALGCFLDGAALGRVFLVGIPGIGGALAMVAIVHGALSCV